MSDSIQDIPYSAAVGINFGRLYPTQTALLAQRVQIPDAVLALCRFMTSEIYELIAQDNVRFFVQKHILTSQSQAFREASTRSWEEATNKMIDLRPWDSDTVSRLVEFLYIRDYTYPNPSALAPSRSAPGVSNPPPEPVDPGLHRPLTPLRDHLQRPPLPQDVHSATDSARLRRSDPAAHDFGETLLAHAKVYALAVYTSIDLLCTLARKRIFLTLLSLHPIQNTAHAAHIARNIVAFTRYIYTQTTHPPRSEEPVRRLTAHFFAINLAALQAVPEAMNLIAEGGDFARDLVVYAPVSEPPADRVTNIHGGEDYVSSCFNVTTTTWLVPEYTTIPDDACTSLLLSRSEADHVPENNLDWTRKTHVYIDAVKGRSGKKITHVALVRVFVGCGGSFRHVDHYDGISSGFKDVLWDYEIHLLWKTVRV